MKRRTINDLLADSRATIGGMDPAAAYSAQQTGALVIDTRDEDSRRSSGTIPGSVHVPLSVLFWRLDPASASSNPALADLDRSVILVCAHGFSSALAAATLREIGFADATDIKGGFEAWSALGLPVEPVSETSTGS